jgi:hypothetical protein
MQYYNNQVCGAWHRQKGSNTYQLEFGISKVGVGGLHGWGKFQDGGVDVNQLVQ